MNPLPRRLRAPVVVAVALAACAHAARPARAATRTCVASVVRPLRTNPSPEYPAALRGSGAGGAVVLQFKVQENGKPDLHTLRVLRESDPAFTESVRRVLPKWRYEQLRHGNWRVFSGQFFGEWMERNDGTPWHVQELRVA